MTPHIPRTSDEAAEVVEGYLRDGMGLTYSMTWLAWRAMLSGSSYWDRITTTALERTRAGFEEHGGDLWTPGLGLFVYEGEAYQELVDHVVYQAMGCWQIELGAAAS